MAKKYEMFEEWMVGKEVMWDGDEGVVTGKRGVDSVWVRWETSEELWIEIDSLEFLDEAPSQSDEDKPIPWQVGQVVWDLLGGKGEVYLFKIEDMYPVKVKFENGNYDAYTPTGARSENGKRALFFSEPKIIADTIPPKKPFVPKLKEGDKAVAVNKEDSSKVYVLEVYQETEDSVAMSTGEVYGKAYYSFFKLGEEIKWD